jgi:type I restriction-modification system DNA methylase subunit
LDYKIVWQGTGLIGKREISDREVHCYLEEKGFERDGNSEWFKCFPEDVEAALSVLKEKYYKEDKRKNLSEQFYEELRNWYYWATDAQNHGLFKKEPDPDFALRIIIRLLLVFFLKEKELVPAELFERNWVEDNLKENEEFRYYSVILRNLFFYSLNTPINQRGELENRKLILHYNKVKDVLHKQIPFLNGGLFTKHSGDDFPLGDDYFFSEQRAKEIKELGGIFPVKGIIRILSQYKYTLDETDGTEYIDPEFIGKMFESLLACIAADSKESRRKITGSYYTPREIVDYMVNESLNAYLAANSTTDKDSENALLRCSILDPACGSGAFPCGVMNEIMRRIDPRKTLSQSERYHKKLEILRNVIYGVDIQPMAVQIAIFRLFLSLIQEIQPTKNSKDNFGIESLPNLEYKFVAANTLMGIEVNGLFFNAYRPLFNQILKLKEDYFRESIVSVKERLKARIELAERELADNSDDEQIQTLCQWNYSDTQASPYFDSRWMFGVEKFDIVIGNPPYGAAYPAEHKEYFKEHYVSTKTISGKQKGSLDTFSLFIENGFNLVKKDGYVSFIVPMSVVSSDAMTALHQLLEANCSTIKAASLSDRPQQIFHESHLKTTIFSFHKDGTPNKHIFATQMYRKDKATSLETLIKKFRFIDAAGLGLPGRYAKISLPIEKRILKKLRKIKTTVGTLKQDEGQPIYYRVTGGEYYKTVTNYSTESTQEKSITFRKKIANTIGAILSSNLLWWYNQVYTRYPHWQSIELHSFPIPIDKLTPDIIRKIERLYEKYLKDIERNVVEHTTTEYKHVTKYKEYKIRYSKHLIDAIDDLICPLYGLTDEETDFIKNYELSFRVDEEE